MGSRNYLIQGTSVFWKRQTPVIRGIVLMCLSTVAFSIMHGLVRFVSEVLPPFQIAFFRNIFGLAFIFPLLMRSRFKVLRTNRIELHALRGVINMAVVCNRKPPTFKYFHCQIAIGDIKNVGTKK